MNYETVMGLEVHVELSTKSKIFCACPTQFGAAPNTQVCPVCSGMPGVLPRLNRSVVEYAITLGLVLDCEIAEICKFDRKNYFYPDLPKAYQVSQLYAPICRNGRLYIGEKSIGIREIHMEEDAGKLIHDTRGNFTFMDFNRCGVPLLEIVSNPDFRGSEEVITYLERLKEILIYLNICDCKMQEGSLRADVNLSLRKPGEELGVRTEMKNLNSFKAISRAIEHETERQRQILDSGGTVVQETRRWDDDAGESYGMRSKENAQDYRYFPEPDLLPIYIDNSLLERIRARIPELAHQKRGRYMNEYKISEFEASVLTGHKNISDLFENISDICKEPVETARLITGEIMRLLNTTNTLPENLKIDAKKLAYLITAVKDGKINRNAYKETIEAVFISDVDPDKYISEKGLQMVDNSDDIIKAVNNVLTENSSAVSDYRSGKDKAFGFLMGQTMKKLGGTAKPDSVNSALRAALDK